MMKHFHIAMRARVILVRGKSERFLHSLIHAALIRLFERISLLASYECRGVTGERGANDPWEQEKEKAFLEKDFRQHERNFSWQKDALLPDCYIVELALNHYTRYFTVYMRVPAVNTELPATT